MKFELLYYHSPHGNVGDDFNTWIFPRCLPELMTSDYGILLAGVGTILDNRIPKDRDVVIFGSGVRPGFSRPLITERIHVSFVRGPLSSAECENSPLYITDPGLLATRHWKQSEDNGRIGIIPYFQSMNRLNWKRISRLVPDSVVIDSRQAIEPFFSELSKCSLVLTESLHGAIFADALGIPWRRFCALAPLLESESVSTFKWTDWSQSLELPYESISAESRIASIDIVKTRARRIGAEINLGLRLRQASRQRGFLSKESIRVCKLNQIEEQIERLKVFAPEK